jgi:hypothetical protein
MLKTRAGISFPVLLEVLMGLALLGCTDDEGQKSQRMKLAAPEEVETAAFWPSFAVVLEGLREQLPEDYRTKTLSELDEVESSSLTSEEDQDILDRLQLALEQLKRRDESEAFLVRREEASRLLAEAQKRGKSWLLLERLREDQPSFRADSYGFLLVAEDPRQPESLSVLTNFSAPRFSGVKLTEVGAPGAKATRWRLLPGSRGAARSRATFFDDYSRKAAGTICHIEVGSALDAEWYFLTDSRGNRAVVSGFTPAYFHRYRHAEVAEELRPQGEKGRRAYDLVSWVFDQWAIPGLLRDDDAEWKEKESER